MTTFKCAACKNPVAEDQTNWIYGRPICNDHTIHIGGKPFYDPRMAAINDHLMKRTTDEIRRLNTSGAMDRYQRMLSKRPHVRQGGVS